MQRFFAYITAEATAAPLDFFTWACYTSNPDEIAMHSQYARNYLDNAGLRRTRSIICEYNTIDRGGTPPALRESTASELGVALILGQKSSADIMMYSTSDAYSRANTLFSMDDHTSAHHYAAFQVMCAYSRLYKLGTQVDTGDDSRKELYSLAATNGNIAELLIVTRKFEGKLELILHGAKFESCRISRIVPGGTRGKGTVYRSKDISIASGRALLPVKPSEIYSVSFF